LHAHALSQLLPTFPGFDLDTLVAFELSAPGPHDGDCDWAMVLSLPAAASPLPSRPATPAQGYAWGVEGMPGGLRAGKHRLPFAEAEALGLGALDIAFATRPADGKIRVHILPAGDTSAFASATPDLTADPDPIVVAPALDAMREDGDKWPGAMATVFMSSRESARCLAQGRAQAFGPLDCDEPDPILDAGARSQQAAPAEPAPEN
jgi:hypothetical protein